MSDTRERIKGCIVRALDLPIPPSEIPDDAEILGLPTASGAPVDSLATLEILVALSNEFDLTLDDVPHEVFRDLGTLTAYIDTQRAALPEGEVA